MSHKRKSCCLILLALLSSFGVSVRAQSQDKAQVSGVVQDQTGASLVDVTLTLRGAGGSKRQVSSGTGGNFLFPFLPSGEYELQAAKRGFSTLEVENIDLGSSQSLELTLTLRLGEMAEFVTVQADANTIEKTSPSIRYHATEETIRELPIVSGLTDRNTIDTLTALTPGASFAPRNSSFENSARVDQVAINGTNPGRIGFSLDGIDNTGHGESNRVGPRSKGPNPDAVSEFSVLTHTFTAETGSDPVIVQVRTKKGSNQLRGQARMIFLDPAFVARDFFNLFGKPSDSTRVGGGQLSGPIKIPGLYDGADKTFFMFDLEVYRRQVGQTLFGNPPTPAEREGDFSALPDDNWPVDPETQQVFSGGIIPRDRMSAQAQYYLDNVIPMANTESGEFLRETVSADNGVQSTVRIDHHFSTNSTLSGSFFFHNGYSRFPWSWTGSDLKVDDESGNVALHYTHVLSPASVNDLSFGFSQGFRDQSTFALDAPSPEELGFNLTRTSAEKWRLPTVNVEGLGLIFVGQGQERYQSETWNLKDSHSILKGAHSLKVGIDFRRLQEDNFGAIFFGHPWFDFFGFNPFGSGNGLADFLLGEPHGFSQSELSPNEPRRNLTSLYFQDNVRLRPNLNLNLGVRYDFYSPWHLASGRNATFRAGVQSTVFPSAPEGMLFVGDFDPMTGERLGESITLPDRNNFAPRIGLAFSPAVADGFLGRLFGGQGKSSLRAGYGIYTMQNESLFFKSPDSVFPWTLTVRRSAAEIDASDGSFANPWGTGRDPFGIPPSEREFPENPFVPFLDPNMRDPYQHQWSFSWQRQFERGFVVEAAYVGSATRNLMRQFEANPASLTPDANLSNVEDRRQFQQFGSVTGYASDGRSSYHGLQLMSSRRFRSGMQFNVNYTWSKTLGNADGTFELADRDVDGWARAIIDQRHRFSGHFLWKIPGSFENSLFRHSLGGWQVTGILRLASGTPLNIRNPVDSTLQGLSSGTPDILAPFRRIDPRDVSTFEMPDGRVVTGNFFYDPTVFVPVVPEGPGDARSGNLGRNRFSGPGVANLDLSLGKRFAITESQQFVLRVDATNALNHAQFTLPKTQWIGTPRGRFQPGRVVGTFGARKIQIYLRYSF